MSEIIPVAKQSPRIDNGVIAWYVGDAFSINWTINLTEDDEPLYFAPGDRLEWCIFPVMDKEHSVHTFVFEYGDIHNNTVELKFTPEISKKFAIGTYTYCVKFCSHDGRVVTLGAQNKIKVESCH